MIRDKDPLVVTNSIVALNEILAAEGGIRVNNAMIMHLLDMFRLFNEWSQCVILELLLKYEPVEDEIFPIMVRAQPEKKTEPPPNNSSCFVRFLFILTCFFFAEFVG